MENEKPKPLTYEYSPLVNKPLKILGVVFLELVILVAIGMILIIVGNMLSYHLPISPIFFVLLAFVAVILGFAFLRMANKQEYSQFLFSFVAFLFQKKGLGFSKSKFPSDKRHLFKNKAK